MSIALQFGCPIETIRAALTARRGGGRAASPIGEVCDALAEIRIETIADGAPGGEGAP